MEFMTFNRKTFSIEAVQVTTENIAELATLCGELKWNGDSPYIDVDRRIVPNIDRCHVGWWVTKLGENIRCYSPKTFDDQFVYAGSARRNVFDQEKNYEVDGFSVGD